MTLRDRFTPFDFLERGVCVILYDRTSPIVYCNRAFSSLISAHPQQIEGRSFDELLNASRLHFETCHELAARRSVSVSVLGGFCIPIEDQIANVTRILKVTGVNTERFDNRTYLTFYVRRATALELWMNKLKLDTNIDPLWKPIATFFLSGHWRPIATLSAPLWMPYLMAHSPELLSVVQQFLGS